MTSYRFTIVVEQDDDGVYISSCPALQGCHSQGHTYKEAVDNLKDAIHLHIEARREVGEAIPIEVAVDKVEISV